MPEERRRYTQTRRAEAAAETRRRIIDATREALTDGPLRSVSLEEIVKRAGVARSTLHVIFGSRKDLLSAVARDALARGGFRALQRTFALRDARQALVASFHTSTAMYAREFAVSNALLSLAATDGDAAEAAALLNKNRREGMESLARRLDEQGYLGAGISREEAAEILWVLTAIETFGILYRGWGLDAETAALRLADMAQRSLGIAANLSAGD